MRSLICGFCEIFHKKWSKTTKSKWYREKSLEKRKHTVTKFVCATKLFERDIAGKRFRKCWSFHVGKVHKDVGISKTSLCNRFSNWCQKLRKMMHVDGSPEYLILVQKPWKCLHSLFQLIYFLLTVSILGFRQMRSQNLTWKKCYMLFLCYPKILAQNSRFTKKCWIFVESPT